ncbi:MAG: outer membrane lipid asymmetry maintenance protein MlaD [Glaciimonas sp.]|nr:outer membrane lipid asymmetry maintenance protein MlaD [Glaciimonas sp.]
MQQKSVDVWVGLFVVLGAFALVFLAFKAGNLGGAVFQGSYPIITKFDNIGGLKPHAPVKSAGVVVGRVSAINFDDKNFQAVVTLNINDRYKFPKDSSAKILTAGLLGEQYIGVEAGGDEKYLVAGESIKMTQSALLLENLISQLIYIKAADGKDSSK